MLECMFDFVKVVYGRGICVIIVGAGGVVYLLGMVVFLLLFFVIGVLIKLLNFIDGWDLMLLILQMFNGVLVVMVVVNVVKNVGIFVV